MQFESLHHVAVLVADTRCSLEFYTGVLGLKTDDRRPDLGYPGAWLKVGEQQIHLMELPNPDPVQDRPAHGGRDRHLALRVDDLEALVGRLEEARISHTLSRSGRKAAFCRDPDGNVIELVQA